MDPRLPRGFESSYLYPLLSAHGPCLQPLARRGGPTGRACELCAVPAHPARNSGRLPSPGGEPQLPSVGSRGSPEPGILRWSRAPHGEPKPARLHPKMPGSTPGEPRGAGQNFWVSWILNLATRSDTKRAPAGERSPAAGDPGRGDRQKPCRRVCRTPNTCVTGAPLTQGPCTPHSPPAQLHDDPLPASSLRSTHAPGVPDLLRRTLASLRSSPPYARPPLSWCRR